MQDIYRGNNKTLLAIYIKGEIYLWYENLISQGCQLSPELIYTFNAVPYQITGRVFFFWTLTRQL